MLEFAQKLDLAYGGHIEPILELSDLDFLDGDLSSGCELSAYEEGVRDRRRQDDACICITFVNYCVGTLTNLLVLCPISSAGEHLCVSQREDTDHLRCLSALAFSTASMWPPMRGKYLCILWLCAIGVSQEAVLDAVTQYWRDMTSWTCG